MGVVACLGLQRAHLSLSIPAAGAPCLLQQSPSTAQRSAARSKPPVLRLGRKILDARDVALDRGQLLVWTEGGRSPRAHKLVARLGTRRQLGVAHRLQVLKLPC